MTDLAPSETRTLIDELLAEQQHLTAVNRFAQRNQQNGVPFQAKYYLDLIPLTKPQPGQQYAFEVNLDKCTGCKACVSACHSLNGLDANESWRQVGLLFSNDWQDPFQQTITTACHHCVDPGCLNGCPVLAYDKDPFTGIVRHLDDQCIGCQYCIMKCPYDVPKYSHQRGIVRKCDMCAGRLAVGEAPACVQACPSEAIRITLVDQAAIASRSRGGDFLPAAPDPAYTLPATRYKSARRLPANLLAGDHAFLAPADSHLPLVFMLVFTQFAAGACLAAVFAEAATRLMLIAAASSGLGLGIATLHLGHPFKAWRAFLGWRKSWFSREVIVFGMFVPLVVAAAFLSASLGARLSLLFRITTAAIGVLGVACSAMIYADTGREFWRASQSLTKFFGTTLLSGTAATLALGASMPSTAKTWIVVPAALLFLIMTVKLAFEHRIFRSLVDEQTSAITPLNKSARLLAGGLGFAMRTRIGCGIIGGIILPALLMLKCSAGGRPSVGVALGALGACLAGELLERYLFFTAIAPTKMPGNMAA